ncbi:hypothetical protein [Pseudarthrobacter sulfonivorans]|uniref:hypothetical protein n=1 Tax=Pseudarthrobacter sulfonivorans TaxID=121292 RepID=UPI002787F6FE|nr:hypothetical protein [Pseudarthrobacter sulfonivorans]MDP9998378.1 hypothetical protein [Pseudarthrobacter sulfonivorans]
MKASVSRAAGAGFAALFKGLKTVRPDRPIHPSGVALTGTIKRSTSTTSSGIPWIDSPGSDAVEGRMSRSLGAPRRWPDILGLALSIHTDTGPAHLLLASTGASRAGRWLLLPRRDAGTSAFTSLMPYKGTNGPVLLAALPEPTGPRLPAMPLAFRQALGAGNWTLGLYYATLTGPWIRFGTLTLAAEPKTNDTRTRFDPAAHPLPGAGTYRWASNLRAPAYATARKDKHATEKDS